MSHFGRNRDLIYGPFPDYLGIASALARQYEAGQLRWIIDSHLLEDLRPMIINCLGANGERIGD
jgi:hypothetical protein